MSRVAYFFSTFPSLTTTFVQREVNAVAHQGLEVLLAANRAPESGEYQIEDETLLSRTFYLNLVHPGSYLKANLNWLSKSPGRYLKSLKLALMLNDDFPGQRLKNLMHLAGAAVLAEHFLQEDVVHTHVHFAFGAASVALFLNALTGIPYSLSIHGSDVLLPQPLIEEKLKRAKFVVSNCQFHLHNLRRRFQCLNGQRFHVVRLGLNLRYGRWSRSEPANGGAILRLLNVARLEKVKAQDVLIRACEELRRRGVTFHCRIVGNGAERSRLERLITDLALGDCVELLGARYEAEVAQLLGWSHVMVLSSVSEGTPMTVIEAMAKARPVVVPRITALPEMVVEGETGLMFEPGSVQDLSAKVAYLAGSPELIKRMGVAARKRAEELFDDKKNADELMSVFSTEGLPACLMR